MKPISWYARKYTDKFGMCLVPVELNRKYPQANDWGKNVITDPDKAEAFYQQHPDWNMGLALGPSNMCSLDIDCIDSFRMILDEFGIPEDTLENCPTIVGNPDKGYRVMFRVPEGASLPYHKMNWASKNDPDTSKHRKAMAIAAALQAAGDFEREARVRAVAKRWSRYAVFELRAATDGKQRQDILPPSQHPETGKPYTWRVQPREDWPEPPAWLLSIWKAWDKFKPQLQDVCPWAEKRETPVPKPAPTRDNAGDRVDVIGAYCDSCDLRAELERYGYKRIGKRYLSPHSGTGLPGVTVFDTGRTCFIHHASDPLCSEETGKPVNAFDLFCYYEHGDDASKAVKAAAELLGIKPSRPARETTPEAAAVREASDQAPALLPPETTAPIDDRPSAPFKALGYNGTSYYYLPRGTEQVAEIKRGSHTSPSEMMALASIEWFEAAYPKPKSSGADWQQAASDLMRSCERCGIYDAHRERGRGAWFDDGRSVLHMGGSLIVDGSQTAIIDHHSSFIYTKQAPLELKLGNTPATDEEAAEALKLMRELRWSKPIHGWLAAGWVALAPICGALTWRPHIWLTAQRGAGKSWAQEHMFAPMIGNAAFVVQGSTTEAGIRQAIGQDARPIIFDEAESENHRGASRMQSVIELARQSSTDSRAEIVKGGATGSAVMFRMRAMFMLGSVNVSLSQAADESRFSVLSLAKPDKTPAEIARFEAFADRVANTLTEEYCAAVRARSYSLIPVIRENAKTMARAVAEKLGSQRIGDQVGTLLAGAYSLVDSGLITPQQAAKIVAPMDFSDAKEAESVSDEESCLAVMLQHQLRVDSAGGLVQRSIGELVEAAQHGCNGLTMKAANEVLGRHGLRVEHNRLIISNSHNELKKILRETPWGSGWRRVLSRMDGAESTSGSVRFAGTSTRAISIPI